jgi:hypothetical protein
MAALYDYQIGTTSSMTNVESLTVASGDPVPAPKSSFKPYADKLALGDGTARGVGFPSATWHWGYLTLAQRNALRVFCSGQSAAVYIRTRKDDDTYANYTATLIWPDEEEKEAGRRLDFTLQFIRLVPA